MRARSCQMLLIRSTSGSSWRRSHRNELQLDQKIAGTIAGLLAQTIESRWIRHASSQLRRCGHGGDAGNDVLAAAGMGGHGHPKGIQNQGYSP